MTLAVMLIIVAVLLLVGFTVPVALGFSAIVGSILSIPGVSIDSLLHRFAAHWGQDYVFVTIAVLVLYGHLAAALEVPARLAGTVTAMLGRGRFAAVVAEALTAIVQPDARGDLLLQHNDEASASVNRLRLAGYRRGPSIGLAAAFCVLRAVAPPGLLVVLVAMVTESSIIRSFTLIWPLAVVVAIATAVLGLLAGGTGERNEEAVLAPGVLVWVAFPILFFLGVMSGTTTPAEAAVLLAALALVVGLVERRLTWRLLLRAGFDTLRDAGALMAVLVFAQLFSIAAVVNGTAAAVIHTLATWPVAATILAALAALWVGAAFIGPLASLFVLAPLFFSSMTGGGLEPPVVTAAAALALALGTIVPPVGSVFATLTVGSTRRARAAIGSIAVFAIPLVAMLAVALVLPAPQFLNRAKERHMAKVLGIGGFFFRSNDPDKLAAWYAEHLGIDKVSDGPWHQEAGPTVLAPFAADSDYFAADRPWMLNVRVDDLDGMVATLEAAGITVTVDPAWNGEYGRFARIHDPEDNPIELWEEPAA